MPFLDDAACSAIETAIYHFNRFPLYSIAANVVAVPITGFWVMPWAMVSCALMPLGLEAWALRPMGWGIEAIVSIAKGVNAWPGAVLVVPTMPDYGLALLSLGGLWLFIWQRRWRLWGLPVIALGYASLVLVRAPDILIAPEFKATAVRAADGGYLLSSHHGGRFTEETWMRRAAVEGGGLWPASGASADGALACDAAGCLYRARGHVVALIRDGSALARDCGTVDLVVSPVAPHRYCPGAAMVDRIDVWRDGGHALWLERDGIRIESVRSWRGDRPWVPRPERPVDSGAAKPAAAAGPGGGSGAQ